MKKEAYMVSNVDDDYEEGYAVVAKSVSQAKTLGTGLLLCDYIDIRVKKYKDVNVSHLQIGEIQDMLWALKKGLYGWIEDKCPRCDNDSNGNRVFYDNGFYCSSCEDEFLEEKG